MVFDNVGFYIVVQDNKIAENPYYDFRILLLYFTNCS
jgi:hypothetical protein